MTSSPHADGYPTVHAYQITCPGRGNRSRNHREGDMPTARCVQRDAVRPRIRRDVAGPAEAHPADLWYPHSANLPRRVVNVAGFERDHPKSLVTPGLAPRWTPMGAREEVAHSLLEVSQSLLLNHLAPGAQPRELSTCPSELAALLKVAGRGLAAWPPVRLLLDGQVPYEPRMCAVRKHRPFLNSGGLKTITRHSNIVAMTPDMLREAAAFLRSRGRSRMPRIT